ncbi:MAG: hypothetical protein ACYCSZ_02665 [Burkholderiales bacterium]
MDENLGVFGRGSFVMDGERCAQNARTTDEKNYQQFSRDVARTTNVAARRSMKKRVSSSKTWSSRPVSIE